MKGIIMKKEQERNIYAVFDDKTIRVYQAYNNEIADEALKLGRFGSKFSLNRMTWIKPSFLWMMYRSGWASKQAQERILAIDLKREGFDEIVKNAVLSSFREVSDLSKEEWKEKLELLLQSDEEMIRKHAMEQLKRCDFTNKDVE